MYSLLTLFGLAAPRIASSVIDLSLVTSPNFGMILAGGPNRRFVLNTDGSMTGPNASDALSGAVAGLITVSDDASPSVIQIRAENITTLGGLSVNSVLCRYHTGGQSSCDNAGISATSASQAALDLGLDITTTQAHSGGDAASIHFEMTVVYL